MAKKAGVSKDSVARVWRAFGLKPRRSESFQLSTDPDFVEKVRDVVGLYLDPPTNALVLSIDEKSQIQALNRTQPLLPMRPGQLKCRTPEYNRNGTSALFAGLDVATGSVIGKCFRRYRASEFLKFIKLIDEQVGPELDVHLIMDNYAAYDDARESWASVPTRCRLELDGVERFGADSVFVGPGVDPCVPRPFATKYFERASQRIHQPHMGNALAGVDWHFSHAVDRDRGGGKHFAQPVWRKLEGSHVGNGRHALAPPAREIGHEHVRPEMQLGLV